jgi:transglutaminase-like putative cysteine protease
VLLRRLLATVSTTLSFLVLVHLGSVQARAFENYGFQAPVPEELQMTGEPLAPGAPAILLYRRIDRDDNGRTSHEDNYFRIKILTEEGRKYADIEIPFFKESTNVVNIHARTISPNGAITNFDGKVFDKNIVKAKGVKYLAKTFTLPAVQVGSILEYYYTFDFSEQYIYDSHWILSDELFTKSISCSLKPYQNSYVPVSLRWNWQGLPPGAGTPQQDAKGIVHLTANNVPAFQTEDYMPPADEVRSRVDFIYSEDTYEKDPAVYWRKKGKKLNDSLESFVGKHKAMEQAVAQIVSPSDTPEVKLQKIYSRVQQMRNTSYEVSKTTQEEKRENEKNINNVEDVWKQGYGNGVQLTWLFLGLVRAAGIEAYGVWASDRRHYFFNPGEMNPHKLDSNVVLVKLNGKDIYCDPGARFTPLGLLPWTETGVQGLRLDKDGGGWVRTELPQSDESQIVRKANLKLSEDGDVEGTLKVTYTGLEALNRRVEERNADDTARKSFLEDEVKEYVPAASEVELTSKPDWNASDRSFSADFHMKVPGWVAGAGRRALFPVGMFSAPEKHIFDHANRVHPIYIEFPFEKVDDITMELPQGWQVATVPKAQNEGGNVVAYTLKVEDNKTTLHLQRMLHVNLLLMDQKYYASLRSFFQVVRTGDEQQVVLQPDTASATK